MSPDGEEKVTESDFDIVACIYEECKCYGQYIRCYFDLFRDCEEFMNFMESLSPEEMRKYIDEV